MDDGTAYAKALAVLKLEPIQGPSGTYHVKNGVIHYGYEVVGTRGFATSEHYWHIFH